MVPHASVVAVVRAVLSEPWQLTKLVDDINENTGGLLKLSQAARWTGYGFVAIGGAVGAYGEWNESHGNIAKTAAVGVADTGANLAGGVVGNATATATTSLIAGLAGGAEDGALIGSLAGPEGTVVGTLVGAAVGAAFAFGASDVATSIINSWF